MSSTYRVVKVLVVGFSGDKEESVVWLGTDVAQLSKLHLRSKVYGADSLGRVEIEDGYIRWHFRFESQNSDQTWSQCSDPRHYVENPAQRALERAIDEENRRLFPGDYLDEEEDDYYDDEWDCYPEDWD